MQEADPSVATLTAFGALTAGTGWVALFAAFLFARPALAVVAVALLLFLAAARAEHRRVAVRVARRVPRSTPVALPFKAVTTARTEEPVLLRIHDPPPAGTILRSLDAVNRRGLAQQAARLEATAPGEVRWEQVRVHAGDRWGLWSTPIDTACAGTVRVSPEPSWLQRGRHHGRRNTVAQLVRSRWAAEPSVEPRSVREYRPGDRARDLDWARSARSVHGLFTRERERVTPRPVFVLLDASATMRWSRREAKMKTASRVALGVIGAGRGAGVRTGLIAFHEDGVLRSDRARGSGIAGVLDELARLPAPTSPRVPPTGDDADDDAEQVPVAAASRAPPPVSLALSELQRATAGPSLIVAILDAELAPRRAEVILDRLRRSGHDVVLAAMATGAHHYARHEAKGIVLERLAALQGTRAALERYAAARQVPFVVLYPGSEESIVQEVARWAR